METGRPPAAPATPPRGGDTQRVIRSGAGSATPGSGSCGDPAPAPGSGAEPAAPARGLRVVAAAGGRRGPAPSLPAVPPEPGRREEGRGGGGARLRPRGERHRHLFARLSPARAAFGAGPPPAGRVGGGPRCALAAPPSAPPLSAEPRTGRAGDGSRAPSGIARGPGPPRRALSARPLSAPVPPPGLPAAAAALKHTIHSSASGD